MYATGHIRDVLFDLRNKKNCYAFFENFSVLYIETSSYGTHAHIVIKIMRNKYVKITMKNGYRLAFQLWNTDRRTINPYLCYNVDTKHIRHIMY